MQKVLILDFGGQYNQLIARRVRECNVYCEVKPYTMPLEEIRAFSPIGIIFTGGPNSVYLEQSPQVDPEIFSLGIPVLGICYGCQLMAHHLGGLVTAAQADTAREYGKTDTYYDTSCPLFQGLPSAGVSWMSHGDYMAKVPDGFRLVGHTAACPNVAIADEARRFYGVQFHPEVNHTQHGTDMLRNFLYRVCGAVGDWTMEDYKRRAIAQLREKIGSGNVLLARGPLRGKSDQIRPDKPPYCGGSGSGGISRPAGPGPDLPGGDGRKHGGYPPPGAGEKSQSPGCGDRRDPGDHRRGGAVLRRPGLCRCGYRPDRRYPHPEGRALSPDGRTEPGVDPLRGGGVP